MYGLKFRITAHAPLIISTISGDMNMVATAQFIPGTTILGMLASRFIAQQKKELNGRPAHENDDFHNWFLAGNLKMSNAYILSQDEYGDYAHYPTPLSIEKEKYGQTVYDRLVLKEEPAEATKHESGFCRFDIDSIYIQSVETRVNFHHARDAKKGVSLEGLIFNYESISRDQMFEGEIFGEEADLRSLLSICGREWTAFVGRSRNAQYGAAAFEFVDEEPIPVYSEIVGSEDEEGNPTESISMTLLSDLILYNEFGYPTADVNDLRNELKKHVGEITVEKAFVRKTEIENFVGVWQLKKPSEICFAKGSAFLLKVNQDNLERLVEIQQNGIGERTHEGFGRCVFGLQRYAELYLQDETEEETTKPDGDIPNLTKNVLTKIARDAITESIELAAIEKQAEFAPRRSDFLPSNALIAKLHAMVKNADNHNAFVENINRLRDLASNQLKRCVSRESNLLEFLQAHPIEWQRFFREQKDTKLKPLCDKIDLDPEADEALKDALWKRYFTTFFSVMRKWVIAEQEDNNG